jgi:hypothetical protein
MNLQEQTNRIKQMMGLLREDTNLKESSEENIKSILFELLKFSDGIKRSNSIWSTNLMVGAPVLYTDNLDEKTFFDVNKNIYDIISEIWPYPNEDYWGKWYKLYYGLVFGFSIYDKETELMCLINVVRWPTNKEQEEKKIEKSQIENQFNIFIYTLRSDNVDGNTIMVDDEIYNIFGMNDDEEQTDKKPINSKFADLSEKLSSNVKDLNQIKLVFYYLDALV